MDLSIFTTAEAWISLITLIFLEIVLGVDNLVFIAITTNRLPPEKQHIGRKLGLGGALVMRIFFLSIASFLVHLVDPLFTIDLGFYTHGISVRDLVLLIGGAYLVWKGIHELLEVLKLTEVKAETSHEHKQLHQIALPQAITTIMIMDLVFSIDSVITAVGLAKHLIIMIIAVMTAVFIMMIFIDAISKFINEHPEMKILALTFIVAIGVLLVIDSLGFHTGVEFMEIGAEKIMVYFAMIFSIVIQLICMKFNKSLGEWHKVLWQIDSDYQLENIKTEMTHLLSEQPSADASEQEKVDPTKLKTGHELVPKITPVIVDGRSYILMPVEELDAADLKEVAQDIEVMTAPIELENNFSDAEAQEAEALAETEITDATL